MPDAQQEQFNQEVQRSLGRIEGGIQAIDKRLDMIDGRITGHSGRINELEDKQAKMEGKAAILGVIGGSAVGVFFWWLKEVIWKSK